MEKRAQTAAAELSHVMDSLRNSLHAVSYSNLMFGTSSYDDHYHYIVCDCLHGVVYCVPICISYKYSIISKCN